MFFNERDFYSMPQSSGLCGGIQNRLTMYTSYVHHIFLCNVCANKVVIGRAVILDGHLFCALYTKSILFKPINSRNLVPEKLHEITC
jgi:hypothetical protein